jgi:hypothetical protein
MSVIHQSSQWDRRATPPLSVILLVWSLRRALAAALTVWLNTKTHFASSSHVNSSLSGRIPSKREIRDEAFKNYSQNYSSDWQYMSIR